MAVITTYNCTRLTGGTDRALDSISVADLADGDRAIVADPSDNLRYFEFQASATDAEDTASIPARVRPDDYSSSGVWYEQVPNVGGTALLADGSVPITDTWHVDGSSTLTIDPANGSVGVGVFSPGNGGTLLVNGNVGIGTVFPNQRLTIVGSMSLKKQAAPGANKYAYGQLWVKDTSPIELWFTDDNGTSTKLA